MVKLGEITSIQKEGGSRQPTLLTDIFLGIKGGEVVLHGREVSRRDLANQSAQDLAGAHHASTESEPPKCLMVEWEED